MCQCILQRMDKTRMKSGCSFWDRFKQRGLGFLLWGFKQCAVQEMSDWQKFCWQFLKLKFLLCHPEYCRTQNGHPIFVQTESWIQSRTEMLVHAGFGNVIHTVSRKSWVAMTRRTIRLNVMRVIKQWDLYLLILTSVIQSRWCPDKFIVPRSATNSGTSFWGVTACRLRLNHQKIHPYKTHICLGLTGDGRGRKKGGSCWLWGNESNG